VSRFWPVRETSQSDYERLREQALLGAGQLDLAAARFGHLGLAALIARPSAAAPMIATVVGGHRPRWSGFEDPRLEALADAFGLLTSPTETSWLRTPNLRCGRSATCGQST
jgi:hypothetical protein